MSKSVLILMGMNHRLVGGLWIRSNRDKEVLAVSLTTIKISHEHYQQIKDIAEKADMGIRAVAERLIAEGLNTTEAAGKVLANNPDALGKIQKDLTKVKEGQVEILDRIDDLEGEAGESGARESEGVRVKKAKTLEITKPSVIGVDVDGFKYHCSACGSPVAGEPEEDRPEVCRDCGAKLDWGRIGEQKEGEQGFGAGGAILVGFLALLALSAMRGRAGNL